MLFYIYSDSPSSTIDITNRCRVGRLSIKDQAEEGSVSLSTLIVDDEAGTLEITGHRRMYIYESDAPILDQVIYNGFVVNEREERGPYRTGAGSQWVVDLADPNVLINRRIFRGEDASRPAENDLQRIQALFGMTEFNTIDDDTYVNTTAAVTAMNAHDYSNQTVGEYIDDCRQASGKNAYILYNETLGQYGLWYDFDSSTVYDSGCFLTNTASEANHSTVFLYSQERTYLNHDPSRIASGVLGEFDGEGSPVYVLDQPTVDAFAAIDTIAPMDNVHDEGVAQARAQRYQVDARTEQDIIHTVMTKVPRAMVNKVKKGHLVSFKASWMSAYTAYTVCRVLHRTVNEISEDPQASFEIEMDLSPLEEVPIEQFGTNNDGQSVAWFTWPEGIPGPGNLLIAGTANRGAGDVDTGAFPQSFPDNTDISSLPIAGTDWTNIDGFDVDSSRGYPIAMAWRDSTTDDTQFARWNQPGGWARCHFVEIAGLSGAPSVDVSATNQSTGGTTFTLGPITVGAAGYIFCLFEHATSGPQDRFGWAGFSMAATAPTVLLTSGWQHFNFGGFSIMCYRYVSAAGTYSLTVERTGAAFDPTDPYGYIMGFWAGPESPTYPAG